MGKLELEARDETAGIVEDVRKKNSDLGGMHTNNRKTKDTSFLRGSAKAYIHRAHPHSTHS
jgi:hypothetical protein